MLTYGANEAGGASQRKYLPPRSLPPSPVAVIAADVVATAVVVPPLVALLLVSSEAVLVLRVTLQSSLKTVWLSPGVSETDVLNASITVVGTE